MRASLARVPTYSQGLVAVNDNLPKVDNAQLAMLIGELKGEMRGFHADLGEIRSALTDASDSRRRMHETLEQAGRRLEKLESTVTVIGGVVEKQTKRIDKIEPLALWLIAAGAGLLVVGGALWYGLLNYGAELVRWLSQIIPK